MEVKEPVVRALGLAAAAVYATFIVWAYRQQPQTMAQVTGGLAAGLGTYQVDSQAFEDGRRFFRNDQYVEARAAFARADPAERDARTQYYIAYTYYRQGWGRLYHDDELYARGLEAVDKAIALAPRGRLVVDDPQLELRSADELRAELEAGRTRDLSDFNPLKLFRRRR
jgi:hypothetical protein